MDELHLLPCGDEGETQVNLLARIGPAMNDGSGVLLSGHLDVVPADEPGWTSTPFEPRIDAGRVYGRGACDMKAAVACFIAVAGKIDRSALRAPLWLLLSCNEEVGSIGVQHFTAHYARGFPLPGECIVGEPTEFRVVRMHKGHLKIRATYHGKTAHTGTPDLGVNAIAPAAQAVEKINLLQERWRLCDLPNAGFFSNAPFPIANVVGIRGGSAWNVMSGRCEVDIGVRLLPGMESQPAIDAVREACESDDSRNVRCEVMNDNPPLLTHDDARVHRVCCGIVNQRESVGMPFASDGGVLKRDLNINCVLFGPGSMSVAHQANEYIALAELDAYEDMLMRSITALCIDRS